MSKNIEIYLLLLGPMYEAIYDLLRPHHSYVCENYMHEGKRSYNAILNCLPEKVDRNFAIFVSDIKKTENTAINTFKSCV